MAGLSTVSEKDSAFVRLSVPFHNASSDTPPSGHSSPSDDIAVSGMGAKTLTGNPMPVVHLPPGGITASNIPWSVTIETRFPLAAKSTMWKMFPNEWSSRRPVDPRIAISSSHESVNSESAYRNALQRSFVSCSETISKSIPRSASSFRSPAASESPSPTTVSGRRPSAIAVRQAPSQAMSLSESRKIRNGISCDGGVPDASTANFTVYGASHPQP